MVRVLGIALIVLAFALAIVPQFTDCESQGSMITLANGKQISMKCHWTAQGEIAVAVPVAGVGFLLALARKRESKLWASGLGAVLGILPILLATSLIGTCTTATMYCNTAMKPFLFVVGGLISIVSLLALIVVWNRKDNP